MKRNVILVLILMALLLVPEGSRATEYSDGEIIITLAPGHTIEEVNETWGTETVDEFPEGNLYLIYAAGIEDAEWYAQQMEMLDPAIAEAEANYTEDTPEGVRQMVIVAVGGEYVDYEDQEIATRIGLDQAHNKSTGYGVIVGVVDSGVDPTHEVFQGRLMMNGYDFIDDDAMPWEEANGIDDDGDGVTDDGYGHGSMVAGIIALVAPAAKILPVRALNDEGRTDAFTMTKAIRYAINQGVDVINMSFGVPQTISSIGKQVSFADSVGISVVAAAGNDNTDNPAYFPAAHSKAMMITALDSLDIKADFADWNSKVLVSAPGTGVRSAYPGGEWGLGAGCSFATPFVTGEVALIRSLAPNMPNVDIEARVEAGVDDIYDIPENQPYDGKLGSGRIFVPAALEGLTASVPDPGLGSLVTAYPNPASDRVTLRLETGGPVTTRVYDTAGRLVRRIGGTNGVITWDGLNERGRAVTPGVYFAILESGGVQRRVPIRIVR